MPRGGLLVKWMVPAALLLTLVAGCSDDDPTDPVPETGKVQIDPNPDTLDAPWSLTDPADEVTSDNGDATLFELEPGSYTIAWGDVAGWFTPAVETLELVAGETITFTGTYEEDIAYGTVVIDAEPDGINAPWLLTGPEDYRNSSSGDLTLTELRPGGYEIVWGDVTGWTAPSGEVRLLADNGIVTFQGVYTEYAAPEYVTVPPLSVGMPVTFTMGSDGESDETNETQHAVTLTRRVTMSATEVTNGHFVAMLQWAYDQIPPLVTVDENGVLDNLDGSTEELVDLDGAMRQITFTFPSFRTSYPDLPVIELSWYGAAAYCDWLSLREGLPRAYDHSDWSCAGDDPYAATGYRLPTEAEWELACRAGTTTPFNTGDCLDAETEANYNGAEPFTGCEAGPPGTGTITVGSYDANTWGLFDMHGNVWEWCNDRGGSYDGDATDPVGPLTGIQRVLRSGGWSVSASDCRSARRFPYYPWSANSYYGFRPVKTAE